MAISAFSPFKIVDLSTHIAGPFSTKWLADYGADVIKVEPIEGDLSRSSGPFFGDDPNPEKSLLFFYLNCNKRGITLNLESDPGRELLLKLIRDADVLVESFRPGYLENLGLGYKDLSAINPKLVMASITPFGQDGPYRDYAGNDLIYYAMSCLLYTSSSPRDATLSRMPSSA